MSSSPERGHGFTCLKVGEDYLGVVDGNYVVYGHDVHMSSRLDPSVVLVKKNGYEIW